MIALLVAGLIFGVEVSAQPAALRLDDTDRAELSFRAPAGDLRVECSAGSVSDLRRTSPGEWQATFRAPRERVPQVALIVARSGDSVGFTALPLWGHGEAEVRTRAGAVVDVQIGSDSFGPVRADRRGRAFVPVVVPPGVDFADQGTRQIDLKVPRTRTVQIGPLPPQLEVDRERDVEIAIAAVTRSGAPLEGAALIVSAWRGEIGDVTALAPGLYRAVWHVPAGPPGAAVVSASIAGDPEPSEAAVRFVAGPAANVALRSSRDRFDPGGAPIDFTAEVVDGAGNPTSEGVSFTASTGALSVRGGEVGRYTLSLEPPRKLDGADAIVVAAARADGGQLASVHIPVTRPVEPTPPPVVEARPAARELAVSARTGAFSDLHGLTAPLLGVEGALRRDAGTVQLALVLGLSWAGARQDAAAGSALLDARDDFFVATAAGAVRVPLDDRLAVWAQAGAALVGAVASVRVTGSAQGEATSRGAEPGLELGVGIERRMWGGVPFVELRYLRTLAFALPNLDGALTAITLCAGYRLELL